MKEKIQVHSIDWEDFSYGEYEGILSNIPIGHYVSSLPYYVDNTVREFHIPVKRIVVKGTTIKESDRIELNLPTAITFTRCYDRRYPSEIWKREK